MAIIKKNQLKDMSHDDLIKRLDELKLELVKDRGQIAVGGSPSNPGRVKTLKKTIAKILTELKRRGEKTA